MARIKQPINRSTGIVLGVIGIIALASVYEFLSYNQHLRNPTDTTIPSVGQLANGFVEICTPRTNPLKAAFGAADEEQTFWEKVSSTWLYKDATATFGRLFKGMAWGCVLSVVLGVLMGCYEHFAALLLPTLSFLAKVPGTAMLAVFFVLVGTGEAMFITMIGFGVLPTLTQAVYLSAKHDIHDEEINKAYTLGASNLEVVYNVVYKQILPKILESVRLQIGPAMVYLIAAEMLSAQVGLGYQIRLQQRLLNMAVVYDYLLLLGLSGLAMDKGMLWFRRVWCPWYSRFR